MYLKRKADAYLNAWKSDPNRSPLIIKGTPKVGKTETIDYFAAHNYRSVDVYKRQMLACALSVSPA